MALGRKAWLFAGSDRGGERAAVMLTLIQTAKLNGVDPQAWLADVLARTLITRSTTWLRYCPGTGASLGLIAPPDHRGGSPRAPVAALPCGPYRMLTNFRRLSEVHNCRRIGSPRLAGSSSEPSKWYIFFAHLRMARNRSRILLAVAHDQHWPLMI